ncbi:MAG TPA: hypothetical protein VNC50_10505 [Planctomycetia bacterium]|nr:hypothetical protein [Planctomycetia bacterium]
MKNLMTPLGIAIGAALSAATGVQAQDICRHAPKCPYVDRSTPVGYHPTRWSRWGDSEVPAAAAPAVLPPTVPSAPAPAPAKVSPKPTASAIAPPAPIQAAPLPAPKPMTLSQLERLAGQSADSKDEPVKLGSAAGPLTIEVSASKER